MKKIIIMITTLLVASLSPSFASAEPRLNYVLNDSLTQHMNVASLEAPNINLGTTTKTECEVNTKNSYSDETDENIRNFCESKNSFSDVTQECNNAMLSISSFNSIIISTQGFNCENTKSSITFDNYKTGDFKNDILLTSADISSSSALNNLKEQIGLHLLNSLNLENLIYVN